MRLSSRPADSGPARPAQRIGGRKLQQRATCITTLTHGRHPAKCPHDWTHPPQLLHSTDRMLQAAAGVLTWEWHDGAAGPGHAPVLRRLQLLAPGTQGVGGGLVLEAAQRRVCRRRGGGGADLLLLLRGAMRGTRVIRMRKALPTCSRPCRPQTMRRPNELASPAPPHLLRLRLLGVRSPDDILRRVVPHEGKVRLHEGGDGNITSVPFARQAEQTIRQDR
jgi:hypothetical protein